MEKKILEGLRLISMKYSWILMLLWANSVHSQINSGVQINLSAGMSKPVGDFYNPDRLAGKGLHIAGGMDYYFFKGVGIGIEGGYFENRSDRLFEDLIYQKYFELTNISNRNAWQTTYLSAGPTVKWSPGNFEFDITGKMGVTQIAGPKLSYKKDNYGEPYDVYRFSRGSKDWRLAWNAGLRTIYKLNYWFGIQGKLDYWSTMGMNTVDFEYTYKDVIDIDRNGRLDSEEFHHASTVSQQQKTDVNVLNFDLGFVFQFGNIRKKIKDKISINLIDSVLVADKTQHTDSIFISQQSKNINPNDTVQMTAQYQNQERIPEILSDSITDKLKVVKSNEIEHKEPSADINDAIGKDSINALAELYFSTTDYQKAAEYYNLLINDTEYPRSRYMYALSLSFNGQCEEAKKEFKQFMKVYDGSDKRSLEILFVSQFENCASISKNKKANSIVSKEDTTHSENITDAKNHNPTAQKLKDGNPKSHDSEQKSAEIKHNSTPVVEGREYQVQFIAIHKAGVIFQSMLKMGSISIEYIKDKKLYRYSLTGYQNIDEAVKDLQKVRNMGYSDAFIAMYENGKRMDTMYHDTGLKE